MSQVDRDRHATAAAAAAAVSASASAEQERGMCDMSVWCQVDQEQVIEHSHVSEHGDAGDAIAVTAAVTLSLARGLQRSDHISGSLVVCLCM